ncbi:branched-chain amino acid transport system II carrier protein, partial [Pseudomonas sp. CAN2814]|uniref:branched-chain amino acid transport system II carrier protein n=1 Tax=Pseudomonas sp. CAN1 TaxID=3046726 RepID=UPI0026491862
YFCRIVPLSYRSLVVILAGFSLLVSNLGLTKLIQFSIPVLTAIYPPCIVLVALSFCASLWRSQTRIVAPVMVISFVFGIIDALKGAKLDAWTPAWMEHLPLAEQGLAWLIPSVAMLAVMVVIDRLLGKPQEAMA